MREVEATGSKIYKSKHDNYLLAFTVGKEKKKFEFTKGLLKVDNPEDVKLIDEEFERRYAGLMNGKRVLQGDVKFIGIDEYEQSRLHSPVQVKIGNKTYLVSEQDIIDMIKAKESGKSGEEKTPRFYDPKETHILSNEGVQVSVKKKK